VKMAEFGTLLKAPGVQVWRIKDFKPHAVGADETGYFFEGDAYITLLCKKAPASSTLEYDIYFWLGSKCSQDESGTAAIKTVELDDALGGGPVQHRETQGSESAGFMSVFPAFQVLAGEASKSGFRKVDGSPPAPRLLQVKGKVTPRMTEVPMSASSLNSGDCFILDANQKVFIWNGADANKNEKAKSKELAEIIRGDGLHSKLGAVVVPPMNQGSESAEFWAAIGGQGAIKAAVPDPEEAAPEPKKLWFLANEGADFQEIASVHLPRGALDPDNIYVASDGLGKWFVWKGPGASKDEKRNCMVTVNKALQARGLPIQTEIVNCGKESTAFKNCFQNWSKTSPHPKLAAAVPQAESAADAAKSMLQRQTAAEKNWDDGSGTKNVFRVDCSKKGAFGLKESAPNGQFFGGDTYVIEYIYNAGKSVLLYLWQGINSTQDERGTGAFELVRMDDKHGGRAVQVIVLQGNEPHHLVSLFPSFIVHLGGVDGRPEDAVPINLYLVKNVGKTVRTVEVQCAAASLNSGDCFFVLNCSDMSTIVWHGRHASTDEQRSAHKAAASMAAVKATVTEGAESEDWWSLLGGKGEYFQGVVSEAEQESIRLFHCTNATGKFKVEEVPNFSQQSLLDETDDVMLLDTGNELYIWNGPDSNDAERKAAKELAATYCQETGRPGMAVFSVVGGHEPPAFTSCFVGWNSKASSKVAAVVAQQAAKPAAAGAASPVPAASAAVQGLPTTTKFSLEALQARAADTVGCDPARLHEYLSDADFQKTFGMGPAEFAKMPGWKQADAKKKHRLF